MIQIGTILKNKQAAKDIWEMELHVPDIARAAKPGQFVNVRLSADLDPILRRPISLHRVDTARGTISMLYLVVGRGTEALSQMQPGAQLDVLGPLGNGFALDFTGSRAVLVGGGIGIAPLYPLACALHAAGKEVCLIAGAKSRAYHVPHEDYVNLGAEVLLATDDGTLGHPGFVTDLLRRKIDAGQCDYLYACGPKPMLRAVEQLALASGVAGQVSTESHMGCGLGVCLCCPNKVKAGGYKRTCLDGPVFEIGELDYE